MPVSWGLRTGRPPTRASACPSGIAVDPAGQAVVADLNSHALRRVSKAGEVSTLADNCESGQGATAHFYLPAGVVLAANGEFIVADSGNHALRVVTPGGAVCTLVGNRKRGFADGQGAAARFYLTTSPVRASERSERARLYVWAKYGSSVCCVWARAGLALDADGSVLVADQGNHGVRRVTLAGHVSTVASNGKRGFADGQGAAARFNEPTDVVADGAGTIVVADWLTHRLRKIVGGGRVTKLAGGAGAGAADGTGLGALQPARRARVRASPAGARCAPSHTPAGRQVLAAWVHLALPRWGCRRPHGSLGLVASHHGVMVSWGRWFD